MYPDWMTKPLEGELTSIGVKALKTPKDVEKALEEKGTTLLVINSVCGCAAGSARPGVKLALQDKIRPEKIVTVFAGVDLDAVAKARTYIPEYPPSSPSIALFKDKKLVSFLQRENIQGKSAEGVAEQLKNIFEKHCRKKLSKFT